jgi:hypothetical protein
MDPDPASDPVLFVRDLQDTGGTNKKLLFFSSFFAYYFLKAHLHHSSKIKGHETVEIKVFLNIFA